MFLFFIFDDYASCSTFRSAALMFSMLWFCNQLKASGKIVTSNTGKIIIPDITIFSRGFQLIFD